MSGIYRGLDRSRREIRLLHIHPGSWDDILKCSLQTVSLSLCPEYQGLSYVWGDQKHRENIELEGQPFLISINLRNAIRRLRKATGIRVIWVDATCINQTDISERTSQVELMSEIYSKANEILIWLGDSLPYESKKLRASPGTVENGKSIEWISNNVESITQQEDFSDHESENLSAFGMLYLLSRDEHWDKKVPFILNDEDRLCIAKRYAAAWIALIRVVQLPWWSRVWTVQEVLLAQTATLVLGSSSVPWSLVTQFTIAYTTHLPPSACCYTSVTWKMLPQLWGEFVQLRYPFNNFFTAQEELAIYKNRRPQTRLWNFLWRIRYKNTSDPRDKVYGILGLETRLLKPDYSLNTARTYTMCMRSLMTGESNLQFLCGPRLRRYGLPSWVIDLLPHEGLEDILFFHNTMMRVTSLPYSADGGRLAQISFDADTLSLNGIVVDIVKEVSVKREEGREVDAIQRWEALTRTQEPELYPTGCTRAEAFWRTLIRDAIKLYGENDDSRRATLEDFPSYRIFQKWLAGTCSVDELNNKSFLLFRKSFYIATQDLTFFTTDKNHYGLGPAPQRGDQIWICAGGRVPFIMRPYPEVSEHFGKYILVGDCFVYGIMDGEAVGENWEERAKQVVLA